jgi:CheY-like chemotaxis protein
MRRILIIDDEPDMCSALKCNLETAGGMKVFVCTNSVEAIYQAKKIQPDVILLDVVMPRLWGTELAQIFRNLDQTKGIPLVFVTALGGLDGTEQSLLEEPFVLLKPFQTETLVEMIERACGKEQNQETGTS